MVHAYRNIDRESKVFSKGGCMSSRPFSMFCRFLSETDLSDLPPSVIDHAQQVLVDTLGVIIAGSGVPEVNRVAARFAGSCRKEEGVTCPGRAGGFEPLFAALLNGMAGSSLEFEEGNSRAMGHPAIQLVPALVADTEAGGLSGKDLLRGLILGYETASRVSRASSVRKGLHPTGTWGVVGSALGVGCGRRKGAEALEQIGNIAASYAFSPYVKNSFVGRNVVSTFAGIVSQAALLANWFFESGIRADEGCLEMTFSQFVSERFDPQVLVAGLGEDYAIAENYFKPYPTCRFTHPALDALEGILREKKISSEEIVRVTVTSFKAAVHAASKPPANVEAMRFSVPYLIAARLCRGSITLGTLDHDIVHDAQVRDLAERVEMSLSKEYEQMRPGRNPAKVTLHLKDGQELTREVMDCLGDPLKPMTREGLAAKFLDLAGPVIGVDRGKQFFEKMQRLESVENVKPLMRMLRAGA
jgi:2-methylcitrate dehydratase PrpD